MPLFLIIYCITQSEMHSFIHIFTEIHSFIHTFITFNEACSPDFLIDSRSPLASRVGIWTQACRTAGQRNTVWATPHPSLSYAVPCLSYAAFYLSYTAPKSEQRNTQSDLRRTQSELCSIKVRATQHPIWATQHPIWATQHPSPSYVAHCLSYTATKPQ